MEQEASGKLGSRMIGLVAEGRLLRVSKENNLLRFATYTIAEDRTSFDKLSAFKHQPNQNTSQLYLLASEYVYLEDKARHSPVAFIQQKMDNDTYYTLLSYDHEGRLSTIFDLPAGEFKVENCDLKMFDGPIVCSINRNQGLVHIIQRDPETTIWEQLTIDPADTFENDKISSNNINLIDVGLYDSHTSAPQLLFACKMTSGSTKSRKSNGHRNNANTNNNNKSNNSDNSDNNNSDHMDIDHDAKSDFWETVNRSGLLKSSNLNALFTQRAENLLDPRRFYILPLEKESKSLTSTIIPSPYLRTCCIVQTYWGTLGQEFTIAGTESGSVMLLEQGRLKNSVSLGSKPIKIALLRNASEEMQIVVHCIDSKVSVIAKKSFALVKEFSKAALVAVDDFTNSFSEQLLVVFKKDAAQVPSKTLFPFTFIDGPNEYSNFKDNIIQASDQDSSRSTLLSVSHSLQSRLRIASENLLVMEQRIKDKKENFVQACNLLEQILTSMQQPQNNNAEQLDAEKCVHINELNCSSEFLENKLSVHFSLDVTNKSKSPIEDCQLILHCSTSTRSQTFAVNIQPNAKSQLNGTLYLEEIPSQSSSEIFVNITAQFLRGQRRTFEHLSTVKLKPEDLFTLQKVPHHAYSCSVAVESKTQAADRTLFDVLKHKLKLDKIDESTWISEKSNISATTTVHTMTTQVDLKAKSEEELLLALQVLCSSLPEDLELSASGLSEGVLDLCDQFVTNITEESNIVSKLTTIQKEFEKDKQKSQKLVQYATSMRQLQKDFIAMQSRTDELYAKLIQLVCTSCA
jgi:hypothetical protein